VPAEAQRDDEGPQLPAAAGHVDDPADVPEVDLGFLAGHGVREPHRDARRTEAQLALRVAAERAVRDLDSLPLEELVDPDEPQRALGREPRLDPLAHRHERFPRVGRWRRGAPLHERCDARDDLVAQLRQERDAALLRGLVVPLHRLAIRAALAGGASRALAAWRRRKSSFTSIIVSSRKPIAPSWRTPSCPEGTTSLVSVAAREARYAAVLTGGPVSLNSAWPHDPENAGSPQRRGVAP
jgi:hypothetical protein